MADAQVQQPSAPAAPPPSAEEQLAAAAEVDLMLPVNQDQTQQQALLGAADDGVAGFEVHDESGELVRERFTQFLVNFSETLGNQQIIYPYVEQANQMALKQKQRRSVDPDEDANEEEVQASVFSNTLFLDYTHVLQNDDELAYAIQSEFVRFEPYLRKAIQLLVHETNPDLDDPSTFAEQVHYFLAVHSLPVSYPVRDLRMDKIGTLVTISGTVTRSSDVRPELLVGSFRCTKCGLLAEGIHQQFHYTRPQLCRNPRCKNDSPSRFLLETKSSEFCDWQKLRVQENSDEIPPGSMPRSIDVIVRNEMVERSKAGDKCLFTGSLVVIPDGSALARAGEAPRAVRTDTTAQSGGGGGVSGLKSLGVRELTYRTCFIVSCVLPTEGLARTSNASNNATAAILFGNQVLEHHEPTAEEVVFEMSRAERNDIREMKSRPRLYEDLVDSIAPSTFGHKEVKKGVLLMLLGGVHKTTVEGIKLRGDINVCIVGDPSTAKSQFLKYTHAFLPSRTVYTSGKASSAAGLTAAVQRDADTGEYVVEAGALMLADNGICCIDEFDKMDPTDQVAIHEAMEQQTISITKAGIQATLNARASILAAANPIYGRYDRTKTLKANVALSAPILSRFDLFFVVLDDCNPNADRQVAQHILNVHRMEEEAVQTPFTKEQMQRYIRFARTINPKITEESQRVLIDCYRRLRQGDTLGRSRSAYRITVRQLESMIRLSEALARLHCDPEIKPAYVREAFRLLKTSIIQVETSDVDVDDGEEDENEDADMGNDGNDGPDTQHYHPGEYRPDEEDEAPQQPEASAPANDAPAGGKKKKRKTKITFEEYEEITNAIATHLRSLEPEDETQTPAHLTWKQVVEWYLEQVEREIGDSVERLEEMRRKLNLVIRRLVTTDMVLVYVGEPPRGKAQEPNAVLAVHPNFVIN